MPVAASKQYLPLSLIVMLQVVLCFLGSATSTFAQSDSLQNPDAAFAQARNLAFSGQREEGRNRALLILEKFPHYLDIKTFVGRTYAWDGQYTEARKAFSEVMTANANTLDNYVAWADMEIWAHEPMKAQAVIEKGLFHFADDPELLYRKAKLLSTRGEIAETKLLVQKLLKKNPNHRAAGKLLLELRSQFPENAITTGFSHERFSGYVAPASFAFMQASKSTPWGPAVARLNYAVRQGKRSLQPELDWYPRFFRNVYGYLSAGYSNGSLFPQKRYGAEIFASLPASLEASAGLRHLYFGSGNTVTIYTGSLGLYTGNYWLSVRPYITPDSAQNSMSAAFTIRKYLKSREHYVSLRLGAGFSPEWLTTQTTSGNVSKEFYRLQSQSVNLTYQHPLSNRFTLNGNVTLGRQQTVLSSNQYSANLATALSIQYRYQ